MPDAIAVGFSINFAFDEKRGIVAQLHVPLDSSASEIDAALDKVIASVERQGLKLRLEGWREKLADDTKRLERLVEDYRRIGEQHQAAWEASAKRGPFKLDQKQEADKRNAQSTIDRYRDELTLDEQRIAECEAKLKRDGT